jgi:hypothetical protein
MLSLMDLLVEIAGWAGALLVLVAYGLLSAGRLEGSSPAFQWLNITGAFGFILNSGWNGAYPSAAVNVVWIGIGLYALSRRAEPRNGT